jgi:hypothetical protein
MDPSATTVRVEAFGLDFSLQPIFEWWGRLQERNAVSRARDAQAELPAPRLHCPQCYADFSHITTVVREDHVPYVCMVCRTEFLNFERG